MPEMIKRAKVEKENVKDKIKQFQFYSSLILVLALTVISISAQASNNSYHIAVLFSKNTAVYHDVYTGFAESIGSVLGSRMAERASIKLPAIVIDKYYADDAASVNELITKLKSSDLLLTIGTQAALTVASIQYELPLLNTFLPKSSYDDISRKHGRHTQVSAIVIDQPFVRQFKLIKSLLPNVTKVGLFVGKSIRPLLAELRDAADNNELVLVEKYIDDNFTAQDINELARNSDAILALPDYKSLSPYQAKWLIYISYQYNKAVFGYSRSIVNAGALAAVYSPPQYIGRQAAEWVVDRMLTSASTMDNKALNMPVYYDVRINKTVAASLSVRQSNIEKLESEYGALAVVIQ